MGVLKTVLRSTPLFVLVRHVLAECDMGCLYGHYTKLVGSLPVDLRGHPIVCYSGEYCTSNLRILRAASTHFPVLRDCV